MTVNFGPNHPSTHGVLRLVVDLYGEDVTGLAAVIGYLHTGFEKNMEHKTWWKAITYAPRMDYVSYQNNEYVFVGAVEKLLDLEIPPKATWMRTLLCELNRIHSHLVWLGTSALELGAISMFWYAFREREQILDLFELVAGYRMHTRYFQVGGLAEDIPRGFYPEARKFCDWMPKAIDDYETLLTRNKIWLERTEGLGLLSADDAIALGQSGPVLRALGRRLGRAQGRAATSPTTRSTSACPCSPRATSTRATACTWRRCASRSASSSSASTGSSTWRASRGSPTTARSSCRRAHELHTSMESLIHHFKIVTEGFRVPEGEVYFAIESPRGELGCYVCSDGGPEAVARQVPRAVVRRAAGNRDVHDRRADRRHDRDRRLARHRDGGGRPVTSLYEAIQAERAKYPPTRRARCCRRCGSRRRSTAGSRPT